MTISSELCNNFALVEMKTESQRVTETEVVGRAGEIGIPVGKILKEKKGNKL